MNMKRTNKGICWLFPISRGKYYRSSVALQEGAYNKSFTWFSGQCFLDFGARGLNGYPETV